MHRTIRIFAFALAPLLLSSGAQASSGAIGNSCKEIDHPVGCYVTTHPDRVTKSVYFYNDSVNRCGVRITNCKNGKCGSFTQNISPGHGRKSWYTTKNFKTVNQTYNFSFSGRSLGAGVREHLKFHIENFDPSTGKRRGTITSYFKASSDGC